ncbi:MAG: homoserine dehydrogenase [Planctomycetes bacterium]|nr:homoserine dehydrogenase [Planctomycetota bacterium]
MRAGVIVLKLGGSVLRNPASLPRAVHEIYRWRRDGYRVVAVVSAFAGETDALLERARALGAGPGSTAAAAATGELLSAALLGAALDRAGVPACVLAPAALSLRAEGDPLEATPLSIDRARLETALAEGLVVVPGFAGTDERGRCVLFGRGGSDLSALFLAAALGARCRLIKDVDGLYEWDPARSASGGGPRPRRYERASWDDALSTDGRILQHRAVRFARDRGLEFEVARSGGVQATRVGAAPTRFAGEAEPRTPLRLVLLGLGTVGGGVWRLTRDMPDEFEIVAVACRNTQRARGQGVPEALLQTDPVAAAQVEADLVVDCLGGLEPARSAIAAALARGHDVVTANKFVLAQHGTDLLRLADAHGARLSASAAVGGGAPVLERIGACKGRLRAVRGVLNGTVNLVLERLAAGAHLGEALAETQRLGLTESDPSRDLDGRDAADKLSVIAWLLGIEGLVVQREEFDTAVESRARAAGKRRGRVRQVSELRLGAQGATARVYFAELSPGDPLYELPDAANAAVLLGAEGVLARVSGIGAGRWPTAEAVVGDLLQFARSRASRHGSVLAALG